MYVTPANLADRPGATELAEVATPERSPIVDADLMDATLRTANRDAWTADQQAVADAALERVNQAATDAGTLIDGFLAPRYAVPVDADQFGIVRVWATAIARYLLHKDRRTLETSDPIVRDYKDAVSMLQLAQAGKFALGAGDTLAGPGAPDVRACPPKFDKNTLHDFEGDL